MAGALRRASRNALLLCLSTAAALLGAEAILRLARPGLVAGPDPISNPFWRYDPGLGWAHTPRQSGTFSRDEFSHEVRINAMGFRDVERSDAAAGGGAEMASPGGRPRGPRIAVFGDSFTWGHGVADDEIFTRVLEGMLPGAEVWNFGVSAYSTDQELLLFRKVAPIARPDVVLVMLSRNDFEGNVSDRAGSYPKPRFVRANGGLALTNVPVPEISAWARAGSALRRRSALANGLAMLLLGEPEGGSRSSAEEETTMTIDLLDLFATEAAERGARFAVALVPSTAHVYPETIPPLEARRFDAIRVWSATRGAPVLDLIPPFREAFARSGVMYHYRADKHWNEEGHRLAAESLARLLREHGLLGRTPC